MGQKVNPIGFRVGVNRDWSSRWCARGREYGRLLQEDKKIREFVFKKFNKDGIARVDIERAAKKLTINIHASRPAIFSTCVLIRRRFLTKTPYISQ